VTLKYKSSDGRSMAWYRNRTTDVELRLWGALATASVAELSLKYGISERAIDRLRAQKKIGVPIRIQRLMWWQANRERILAILDRQGGWDTVWRKVPGAQVLWPRCQALRTFICNRLAIDNIDVPGQRAEMPDGWLMAGYIRMLNRTQKKKPKSARVG